MKTRDPLNILCNTLLTALLTIGILGCMRTAFSVEAEALLLFIVLFSLFACVCCAFRWGVPVLAGCLIVAAPALWLLGIEAHAEAFLWKLSRMYNQSYDLGFTIWWTENDHTGMPTTLFFVALAFLLISVTAIGLSRRRIWPGFCLTLPLLAIALAVPSETLSGTYFLITLLACGILALSALVRRHNPDDAPSMTLRAAVSGICVLALLCSIFPKDSYAPGEGLDASEFVSGIVQWFSPNAQTPAVGNGFTLSDTVDLGQLRPGENSDDLAFTARSDYQGYVYLRGRSYESYTGTAWSSDPELVSTIGVPDMVFIDDGYLGFTGLSGLILGIPTQGTTKFTTHELKLDYKNGMQNRGLLYIPANPDEQTITGGYLPKQDMQSRYTHTFQVPEAGWNQIIKNLYLMYGSTDVQAHLEASGYEPDVYLSLPENTYIQARNILYTIGISADMPLTTVVSKILTYVSQIAEYNAETANMPKDTEDFALWFLTESESGYCVHYASAAAVLLRAAGIPARYVEGYLYYSQANRTMNITQQEAHAWVEYYVPTLGWMILEATPEEGLPEPLPEVSTTEPVTVPATTEPTTVPPTVPTTVPPTEPSIAPTTEPTTPATEPSREPTQPTPSGNGGPAANTDYGWLLTLARILGWIGGICMFLFLQWWLRLKLLLRILRQGEPNAQALKHWRYCRLLAKLLNRQPPKDLRDLAEKAKFSQHTLTQEELLQFILYRNTCVTELRKKSLGMRFVYRFILALY